MIATARKPSGSSVGQNPAYRLARQFFFAIRKSIPQQSMVIALRILTQELLKPKK
jgi:hypothetical protein